MVCFGELLAILMIDELAVICSHVGYFGELVVITSAVIAAARRARRRVRVNLCILVKDMEWRMEGRSACVSVAALIPSGFPSIQLQPVRSFHL